jgi:hypothetical protein
VLLISGSRSNTSKCSTAWQQTTVKIYPVEVLAAEFMEPGVPSADIVASLSISIELAFLW